MRFDYVIVSRGAPGCAPTARLSDAPAARVRPRQAGDDDGPLQTARRPISRPLVTPPAKMPRRLFAARRMGGDASDAADAAPRTRALSGLPGARAPIGPAPIAGNPATPAFRVARPAPDLIKRACGPAIAAE